MCTVAAVAVGLGGLRESDFARGESEDAAPSGEDGHVLLAVDSVGHGSGDDAALRVGGPELLTVVGTIGFEVSLRGAFKN